MVGASLLAAAALVVAIIAALAATGRLRRNAIAGIRISSLYASETAWRVGHRAAVLPTATGAALCVVLAVVVYGEPDFASTALVLETVVLVAGVLAGTALASRAARHQPR